MRIAPKRHELEFGEGLAWAPPAGAARFFVWDKTEAFSGTAAPRWLQVAGYDLLTDQPIVISEQASSFTLSGAGVEATWGTIAAAGDGYDPEFALITSEDATGHATSIDRYSVPVPESSAAATIAAQERAYLQSLLDSRQTVAAAGGRHRIAALDGMEIERMDIAVLDRRVAETRARIAWFEAAASGNALPRLEMW